ncbi:MAG: integrase core domain-containing protein [Proteobacteria bacterium]|nr:integrase core domain-containing protein [Pseudomonadota bacterium]
MPHFPIDLISIAVIFVAILVFVSLLRLLVFRWASRRESSHYSCRAVVPLAPADHPHHRKKADWILREVLRLKALMGRHAGCRKVATTFNRLRAPASVGKTFVAEAIKNHQYLLRSIAREIRNRKPLPAPINSTWAMDMTFVTDTEGATHACVGIIDHGSRVCTRLAVLLNKRSWTLLGHLCLAIGQNDKPKALRTDNEATMNSFVFRTFLKLVGIRKQTIPLAAPWCNGRIERFFGTAKPWLRALVIPGKFALQATLDQARDFYNHVRPHQSLDGLTPAEVWQGLNSTDIEQMPVKSATLVQALDAVLVGYHIRR